MRPLQAIFRLQPSGDAGTGMKLGVCEQNPGLKYGSPHQL
jgi:hypothetical protein